MPMLEHAAAAAAGAQVAAAEETNDDEDCIIVKVSTSAVVIRNVLKLLWEGRFGVDYIFRVSGQVVIPSQQQGEVIYLVKELP